ncbi:PhzF family phenazine biosynthesis protein [Apibacter raozihei]|uniref:PhzF family phenazine biosynthesis protein n=1 Tax=Apibacter raozihei TaxID=2500547 RepID=UPI001E3DB418|nr:PhzF family phenazine biosynthesis protein [Apibacter raozihei]
MESVIEYYIIDAFASQIFSGNQAGVCYLKQKIDDQIMQQIAAENNLSETAFILKRDEGANYDLRWFTPKSEVDLCGHATLASAYVLSNFVDSTLKKIQFYTQSGILTVNCKSDKYEMEFPSREPKRLQILPLFKEMIDCEILEAWASRDLILVVENEDEVRRVNPDLNKIAQASEYLGVIITSKGKTTDFVSRFFAPSVGVAEDPVTGSAHTSLIPLWNQKLGKKKMIAYQCSQRGGYIYCDIIENKVLISGYAKLYLKGSIYLS